MRTFAKNLSYELSIDYMRVALNKRNGEFVLYYILSDIIKFSNDVELFELYSKEYDEAFYHYKLFEERISDYVDNIVNVPTMWHIDLFYNAIFIDIESEDVDTTQLLEEGYMEIEGGTRIAFRDRYMKYQDMLINAFPEIFTTYDKNGKRFNRRSLDLTLQVTDDCNLCCTYCYQTNKGSHVMSKDIVDKTLDTLLFDDDKTKDYIDKNKYPTVIIELIGGEGMLYPELNEYIVTQLFTKMINSNHQWLKYPQVHVATNGVNYFNDEVQKFYSKWEDIISISITVDGDKKLHDMCRLFPNGNGSYEIAHKALLCELNKGNSPSTKITLSPDNIPFIKDGIIKMIDEGFPHIWFNAIYEHHWTVSQAREYLYNIKQVADYLIDNNLYNHYEISIFDEALYKPKDANDYHNWCGGDGSMLAIDYKGDAYNCLRYMESSLNGDQPELKVGDIYTGLGITDNDKKCINCMKCIDRRSQSTDECFNCSIAGGCSWCSAYNYQVFGTPNKRSTGICNIHKANALATAYFFNTIYKKELSDERFDLSWVDRLFFADILGDESLESVINL